MSDYNGITGLSEAEAESRRREGKVNTSADLKTKSVGRIIYDNTVTLFNVLNVVLFAALIFVGSYKNMLFIGVVVANTAIGIFQEIRSKRSVEKLSILSERKITVLRGGKETPVSREDIVLDDVLVLSRGSQVPADCVVIAGESKLNEGLLTGESDLIAKKQGDELLSGSFVASGKCLARVCKVGADCYAAKINSEAKYIKKVNSEILKSFNFIIKLCTCVLFPVGIAFFIRQFGIQNGDIEGTVVSTVAALIGMIPKGMILLTTSVLAVSVIRLTRKDVLVQEMYCIETLARVDVLCLDKTGTLTADKMNVCGLVPFGFDEAEIKQALASVAAATEEPNATVNALLDFTENCAALKCGSFTRFSSETKWSGGNFENGKSYYIGASEFLFKDKEKYSEVFRGVDSAAGGVRILALAESTEYGHDVLPAQLKPMALVLIRDTLRDNVNETIEYFKKQGVALKVISGDSIKTVSVIAAETGIEGAENAIDMTEITTDEQLAEAAEKYSVFGRVTPHQKKKLVLALKAAGHSVAMTGDGVNDVLALKEADCSVAMASGSDAARNVSQLVLVNDDFAAMPDVVAEGRRTINNLERSSALYLVKTIYSVILAVIFIFFNAAYPFEPIQLTLVGALTVALPSFVLALQPSDGRINGNFTARIIAHAVPSAFCVILNIVAAAVLMNAVGITQGEMSAISVYLTALSCYLLVLRLSFPINALRGAMLAVSLLGTAACCIFFPTLFSLSALSAAGVAALAVLAAATVIIFNVIYAVSDKVIKRF